jgi:hypothetical protein
MQRLVVKLSALRKTLRGEERKLLDRMVLSTQAEVTLHKAEVQYRSAVQGKVADKSNSEVGLHAANVRAKTVEKSHAEVGLHSSKVQAQQADSATQSASMGMQARQQVMRIRVDSKSQAYKLVTE